MSAGPARVGDLRITNIGQLVDPGAEAGVSAPLEVTENTSLTIRNGRFVAGSIEDGRSDDGLIPELDARGGVVLPGLVDSHTHAVFGATREHEFERRLAGDSYQEIAAEGGGIAFSVRDLRTLSEDALHEVSLPRVARFLRHGVTTVEIKSGYGLSTEDELKMLRVIRRLSDDPGLPRIVPTFLGAHAVPEEFRSDRASFVRLVVDEMLPAVRDDGLAVFCDVFCDEGAFTVEESEEILGAAGRLGFGLKLHADEFASVGGAGLAVRLGATSADHLVAIDEVGIRALAESTTVAVLLPGTSFFLRLGRHAPARALADAGATLAVATDFNPGSSMTQNLLLMVAFACCNLGLSIPEAVRAATRGGACALALEDRGALSPGSLGDCAIFDVPDHRHLAYHYGVDHCAATVCGGDVLWRRPGGPQRFDR